jgi:hypothetical protein
VRVGARQKCAISHKDEQYNQLYIELSRISSNKKDCKTLDLPYSISTLLATRGGHFDHPFSPVFAFDLDSSFSVYECKFCILIG